MNVLILGVTGMLGHRMWHTFQQDNSYTTFGTVRNPNGLAYFPQAQHKNLLTNIDVLDQDQLIHVFNTTKPDVVINCIGLVKQLDSANDPLVALPINALFPHRLAKLCALTHSRLIHISTDCVFSGKKGLYLESDNSDAEDLYGKSKFIGEITQEKNALTLRTSIIGHELNSKQGLVEWFLAQNTPVKGYAKALFSGLPTVELARVIKQYVIPNKHISGLYQVAAQPISKYELLLLIAEQYGKKIIIEPDEAFKIDRSLNGTRFNALTHYEAPSWPMLIKQMHQAHQPIKAEHVS